MIENKPKAFKAYSMAQPIKKDIDDTLARLEIEKRQFLAHQRQQTQLKQILQKKRKQLNELKYSQFQTKTHFNKSIQNNNIINNVDRNYQNIINSLNQLRSIIEIKRKQIDKYKKLNNQLNLDQEQLNKNIDKMIQQIEKKDKQCNYLTQQLVDYRNINHKNTIQFQKSHYNLTRSDFKGENFRRKSAVLTKTFLGQQLKKSRALQYQMLSQAIRDSGIHHNQGASDIMTESVPLAKHRVAKLIYQNKQKLKISENYRKFGQGLSDMFDIMKNYKGRDDLDFLAEQFVAKQKQIQKLEQYVSGLEGVISVKKKHIQLLKTTDQKLSNQLGIKNQNQLDKYYEGLNQNIKKDIQKLRNTQKQTTQWLNKIANIVAPFTKQQDTFNRSNAIQILGQIQDKIQIQRKARQKVSPNRSVPLPHFDIHENRGINYQLMSYQKMKEYAEEYLRTKLSS